MSIGSGDCTDWPYILHYHPAIFVALGNFLSVPGSIAHVYNGDAAMLCQAPEFCPPELHRAAVAGAQIRGWESVNPSDLPL